MLAPLVIPLVVLGTALLILFNTIGIPFSGSRSRSDTS